MERHSLDEILLSDFLPEQYEKFRNGSLKAQALPLLLDKVQDALIPYRAACNSMS
jgi:D-tagatose-1,6-bisphosphate aldolase subunit GatZ/KbaZ